MYVYIYIYIYIWLCTYIYIYNPTMWLRYLFRARRLFSSMFINKTLSLLAPLPPENNIFITHKCNTVAGSLIGVIAKCPGSAENNISIKNMFTHIVRCLILLVELDIRDNIQANKTCLGILATLRCQNHFRCIDNIPARLVAILILMRFLFL